LRYLLNAASDTEFFTDTVLNDALDRAYLGYAAEWIRRNNTENVSFKSFTYTAAAERTEVTFASGLPLRFLDYLEDRTNVQPGTRIPLVDARDSQLSLGTMLEVDIFQELTQAYVETAASVSTSGAYSQKFYVYLAPKPSSARKLRLHYQWLPQSFVSDNSTTGMPAVVEDCILYSALCEMRGIREESPDGSVVQAQMLLARAEKRLNYLSRQRRRGAGRVRFDSSQVE
jgi:hypothetical protein